MAEAPALGGHERRDPASVQRRISPSDGVDQVLGQYGSGVSAEIRSRIRRWQSNEVWHRRALMMLAVGLIFAHVIGLLVTTGLDGPMVQGDARSYFAYMPSLLLDRDLDLRNQFAVLRPEGDTQYPFGVGRGGRARNPFPIAPALLWLPGYTIGVGVDALRGQTATDVLLGYGVGAVWGKGRLVSLPGRYGCGSNPQAGAPLRWRARGISRDRDGVALDAGVVLHAHHTTLRSRDRLVRREPHAVVHMASLVRTDTGWSLGRIGARGWRGRGGPTPGCSAPVCTAGCSGELT